MISRKSGAIFERKLIEEYISAHGKDPISEENLTIEDLTKVQGVPEYVPPQLPSLASIPNLLKTFQNEWDALALEVFSLRKQLHKAPVFTITMPPYVWLPRRRKKEMKHKEH